MRVTIFPLAIILTKAKGCSQYDGQGEYCGLSTASELFPFSTIHLYSFTCNYNAIDFKT